MPATPRCNCYAAPRGALDDAVAQRAPCDQPRAPREAVPKADHHEAASLDPEQVRAFLTAAYAANDTGVGKAGGAMWHRDDTERNVGRFVVSSTFGLGGVVVGGGGVRDS